MTTISGTDQLAALRQLVFHTIESWNGAHPHPLHSHQERGSVTVTVSFTDADGAASYAIKVGCSLAGSMPLTFHGHDLASVAEHARLTLEHRIADELRRRAEKAYEEEFDLKYGVAV